MGEAQAHYDIARMQYHLQQTQACQEQLQLALKCDPNYGPAREFLAELGQTSDPPSPVRTVSYEEPARGPAPTAAPALARTWDKTARPAPTRSAARVEVGGIE
jgi:hypothetical protein